MVSKFILLSHINPSSRFTEKVKSDHPGNAKTLIFSSILISFLGSLPLGTVNIVMVQQAVANGYSSAFWFAAGSLIAEMLYVGISLVIMHRMMKLEIILKMLQWVSLFILIAMAIISFLRATQEEAPAGIVGVSANLTPFFFGFLLMAINPVQIPFWLAWSSVLLARKILMPHGLHYALYIGGAGLGSLMGSILFIFAGQFLLSRLPVTQIAFHGAIGCVFMLTAFMQARKMLLTSRSDRAVEERKANLRNGST